MKKIIFIKHFNQFRISSKLVLIFLMFCSVFPIQAQDGTLDATFVPGSGLDSDIWYTCIQSDGKILIAGAFTTYNGTSRNHIARINSDGSLDATFNPGTGSNGDIWWISIQSDGKIIICGSFTSYNGTAKRYIARLNSNGSLDNTFNLGTGGNDVVLTTAIQSDGKIIIGGYFTAYNGTSVSRIARLNSDGSLDATFNSGTGANSSVYSAVLQSDGKVIISGLFTTYNSITANRIVRINTDGSIDAAFNTGTGTGANQEVWPVAIQSDGKIIIGGDFTTFNGVSRNRIARLNSDGTLDAAFTPGTGANDNIRAISIQWNGKIIIGGMFNSYNGTTINYLARINSDGTYDATFSTGTGPDYWVFASALQSDGKLIIGGRFSFYNGTARNRIARINSTAPIIAGVSIAITSGSNPSCAGSSVTFTATPTNGGTNPAYQWKVDGNNIGTNSPIYTTTTLTNGQIVTCVMTSNLPGVLGNPATSNAITMTINPVLVPAVSIAITSGSNPSCAGASVTYTATPTNGGTTPSYQWKVNGGNAGTNSALFTTTTLANNDVVTCVLTSNASCANPVTATSNSITMTINPVVVPAVSIAITSGSNPMCAGASVTFTATPVNGGTSPSYQWKVNGGNVGTNSPTYTSSGLTNGQIVSCVLTSNATCANPVTATSNSITMTVYSIPPKPTITQNLSVLTSSAPAGNQWYLNSSIIPGATSQSYTCTQNGSYTVIVTLNGCSSPVSDPLVINNVALHERIPKTFFNVFPNPAQDKVSVNLNTANLEGKKLQILNLQGKVLLEETIIKTQTLVDIKSLSEGVYFVRVKFADGSQAQEKFVVVK